LPENSLGFISLGYGYWKLGINNNKKESSVLTDFDVSSKVLKF